MVDEERRQILELSQKYTSPREFIEDPIVEKIIEKWEKEKSDISIYDVIIKCLVNTMDISNKDLIEELFSSPKLTISSYKKFLRFKGLEAWENYRQSKQKLFVNLSSRICDYLIGHSVEETECEFLEEINMISGVTGKSVKQIVTLFGSYKKAYNIKDSIELSNNSAKIKSLIKAFNSKTKEHYINIYINSHVNDIMPYFKQSVIVDNDIVKIGLDEFCSIVLKDSKLRNKWRMAISDKFYYVVDNEELAKFIVNILNENDQENLKFLGLLVPPRFALLSNTRAYNRFVKNYLGRVNKNFDVAQLELINKFLSTTDKDEKNAMSSKFTKEQLKLLNEIRPILYDATGHLTVVDQKFNIFTDLEVLDEEEEIEMKTYKKDLNSYFSIKNMIARVYYNQCEALTKIVGHVSSERELSFTDDNYVLNNFSYLFKLDVIVDILSKLDKNPVNHFSYDDEYYKKLKCLLSDQGLLSCILVNGENSDIIANIINNVSTICKGNLKDDFNMSRLSDIVKHADLYKYIDNFTLAILGEEVAEKIVYNFQFLQGKNTPDKIKSRLDKAVDLMIKAQDRNMSCIPYFDDIICDNIRLSRYKNNDPDILTSGIDSNTCFKISANDNDYLFYSVLNKNGMVARLFDDDKMCGRITAHTFGNVLLINGVRTVENNYQSLSLEEKCRNDNMLTAVKMMADKLIELTSDSDCPIDFVVSNKAGILESPEYNSNFSILPDHLFKNPIDCYHEDFDEFKNMYNDRPGFLQEVIYHNNCQNAPFTTDFGHYPVVLISSREGKQLTRLSDIALDSPEAIYERPCLDYVIGRGRLDDDNLRRIVRIDALRYSNSGGESDKYRIVNYNDNYEAFEIDDDNYVLVTSNGSVIHNSINKGENISTKGKESQLYIKKDSNM